MSCEKYQEGCCATALGVGCGGGGVSIVNRQGEMASH